MKTKFTVAAILLSTLGLASKANAAEVSLQYVVDHVVTQAVSATATELSNNVYNAVVSAGLHFDSTDESYKTKVLISKVNEENTVTTEKTE